MLAPIESGDTTQWQAIAWAFQQGQYLTPTQQLVLLYLTGHAFYQADNPEGGEVGQVMRSASYVEQIEKGTALHRVTIRRALTSLQMAGYVQRGVRDDRGLYGQQPHMIHVLWECDEMRQGLRDGTLKLPEELMAVPSKPAPSKPEAPVLALVKTVQKAP